MDSAKDLLLCRAIMVTQKTHADPVTFLREVTDFGVNGADKIISAIRAVGATRNEASMQSLAGLLGRVSQAGGYDLRIVAEIAGILGVGTDNVSAPYVSNLLRSSDISPYIKAAVVNQVQERYQDGKPCTVHRPALLGVLDSLIAQSGAPAGIMLADAVVAKLAANPDDSLAGPISKVYDWAKRQVIDLSQTSTAFTHDNLLRRTVNVLGQIAMQSGARSAISVLSLIARDTGAAGLEHIRVDALRKLGALNNPQYVQISGSFLQSKNTPLMNGAVELEAERQKGSIAFNRPKK